MVSTHEPADTASRSCELKLLKSSLWHHGPKWLQLPENRRQDAQFGSQLDTGWSQAPTWKFWRTRSSHRSSRLPRRLRSHPWYSSRREHLRHTKWMEANMKFWTNSNWPLSLFFLQIFLQMQDFPATKCKGAWSKADQSQQAISNVKGSIWDTLGKSKSLLALEGLSGWLSVKALTFH